MDVRTDAMGFCVRRKIGLNFKYNKAKWEFIAKEKGRGQ